MQDFIIGFTSFFKAFRFIGRNRLVGWYLVPFFIWLILVVLFTIKVSDILEPYIQGWLYSLLGTVPPSETGSKWQTLRGWFTAGLEFTIAVIVKIMIWYLLGRIMKYFVLILTSPLLAYLSERTEEILTGRQYPFSLPQLLKDTLRGILITLRNLFFELICMAAGFFITITLPLLAPLITLALFFINCYFMGFSLFDYVAERRKMNLGESVNWMSSQKWKLVGLGFAFNLVSMVYLLDWIVAPINGAVGAAIASDAGLPSKKA
jgi:CysZ protein